MNNRWLDHAPSAIATVDGASHMVRYANPAFCRLVNQPAGDIRGRPLGSLRPELLETLDRVYATGQPARHPGAALWPVIDRGGIMVQMIEPAQEKTLAMNEALMVGSVRQHELTEAALLLTHEISHRIKNNLQVVMALIANEARRAGPSCREGYTAMQARIGAIAKLYDLMSQSHEHAVHLDSYLGEIAQALAASLLGHTGVTIEVMAEAVQIRHEQAVPAGLLINELATNAIKHAFPGGTGRVMLRAKQAGDQIELSVADNGIGMQPVASRAGKHGSDYVTIFVRQLGGTMAVTTDAAGTSFTVRFPR